MSRNILRQRSLPPQLFGFKRLIDGFLSSVGPVFSSSAALHHTRAFHLLVPRPGQNIVRFPILIRHHPRDLTERGIAQEGSESRHKLQNGQKEHEKLQRVTNERGKKLTRLHSGRKKSVEQLLTHLSGHVSGEVAVRGEFEMTAVARSVIHNIYFS